MLLLLVVVVLIVVVIVFASVVVVVVVVVGGLLHWLSVPGSQVAPFRSPISNYYLLLLCYRLLSSVSLSLSVPMSVSFSLLN